MATKSEIAKIKPPKLELIDKKNEFEKENKKVSKVLIWILIILIIISFLELVILIVG